MPADPPPSLDPVAAARWSRFAPAAPAWLHEEVGRRMEERLQWIKRAPEIWADWEPLRGGLAVHASIARRYPAATCFVVEPDPRRARAARQALRRPWWVPARWSATATRFEMPGESTLQMLWANMALHMASDPQALLAQWHKLLAPDGFLMFSCLGPDTLRAVREAYRRAGWPPPAHEFTDMHDWGDMLVHTGFAEPVMDMERITLTFEGPARALRELRQLGRNLHRSRSAAVRTRRWRDELQALLAQSAQTQDQAVALEFEIIYGHALKAAPRLAVQSEASLSLDEMRRILHRDRASPRGRA